MHLLKAAADPIDILGFVASRPLFLVFRRYALFCLFGRAEQYIRIGCTEHRFIVVGIVVDFV
jgi:hypothetical protein